MEKKIKEPELGGLFSRGIDLLKKIPIDLGQQSVAHRTKGKEIALGLIPIPQNGMKALDVGAREGVQTRNMADKGYDVTSIDLDPQFPECQKVDVNSTLPFEDNSFDVVWCSEVIEHLVDPKFVMTELRRITKPNGDLILTTPNSYALLFRFIALFGLTPPRIQRKDHIHFFDLNDVKSLAPDANLYGYFPYMIIKKTITNAIGALSPTFVIHIKK